MRVLVIEDDPEVAQFLQRGLTAAGHEVTVALDGKRGLLLATTAVHDALIVDRMLPGVDGITIIRTLRASQIMQPVLILSAVGELDDRVDGLRAGGDDYLVKPFALAEVLARLDALARRVRDRADTTTTLALADLQLDLLRHEVRRAGRTIDLQPREFQLLEFLMRHARQVVTRTMLLEHVWGYHFDPQTNVIDVHISRLRAKIDRDQPVPLIHTIRGVGYRLGLG